LPWKNRVALKNFTVLDILFTFRIFNNLCCPENRVSPEILHCIKYFFYHSGFLSNFVLSLKNRGCPEFTVLIIYFLSFRIFEQLALALKNRVALIYFHCIKHVFYIILEF